MLSRRFYVLLLIIATALLAVAGAGFGRSAGADAGWASGRGCNCHGSTPSTNVVAIVEGIGEHWEPGKTYDATIKMSGANNVALPTPVGMNAGGFAIDFSAGLPKPVDDRTQVVGTASLTHTEKGNDVREWRFQWVAPTNATNATLQVAVNAVNGDDLANPLDQWNKKVFSFGAHPAEPATGSPTASPTPTKGSPGLGVALVLAVGASIAFSHRRRRG